MSLGAVHRLEGLEPDNLLAFLALLGLVRSLDYRDSRSSDELRLLPRISWSLEHLPIRPLLHLARATTPEEIAQTAAEGLDGIAEDYDFGGRKGLSFPYEDARNLLEQAMRTAAIGSRGRIDLLSALMSDGAVRDGGKMDQTVEPTPLCLLFGQGHQHFLERLAEVPRQAVPPPGGGRDKQAQDSPAECLHDALFSPWHRTDPTRSFRWDPEEDVRYALMAGDPTAAAYKGGTQHGANRLAAVGIGAITVVPTIVGRRVRVVAVGGAHERGRFSFAWPIWRDPATFSSIRALLAHPDLREPRKLAHLGVDHVMVTQRISVGKFMNFTRARHLM